MMTIREYARPATLEEAWQLNQKKPNRVLGGMLWLKMEKINVGTAIDCRPWGWIRLRRLTPRSSSVRWQRCAIWKRTPP